MDLFSSMRVSATGLDAETKRINTISSNLANEKTVGYKRKDPELQAQTDRESFGEILQSELDEQIQGVQVVGIAEDQRAPRMVYEPHNPKANSDGMVAYPNVNPTEEMANMISAQ